MSAFNNKILNLREIFRDRGNVHCQNTTGSNYKTSTGSDGSCNKGHVASLDLRLETPHK